MKKAIFILMMSITFTLIVVSWDLKKKQEAAVVQYINDQKVLKSKEQSGLNDVFYDKYCMDGLVIVSTKMTNFYYRKPDNSLVTCEEYNAVVTDI